MQIEEQVTAVIAKDDFADDEVEAIMAGNASQTKSIKIRRR